MPVTLSPILSAVPFNSNVAFNNSWVTVNNDQNRALFAQATYIVNNNETANGFDFIDDATLYLGSYQTIKVVADCKIAGLTADNSFVGNLTAYELPQGFELNGQIYAIQLSHGAVLAYKTI